MATATSVEINDVINSKNRGENPSEALDSAVRLEKPAANTVTSSSLLPASGNSSSTEAVALKEADELKGAGKVSHGDSAPVSDTQRKMRRAERFGISVQLSEEEKRNSRAERFGMGSTVNGSGTSKKSEEVKRKARAERFGLPASVAADDETKKKARLARFASTSKADPEESEKRKARAIRFSNPSSNSPLEVNGKENTETIPDIAGEAGGGA